MGNQGVFVAEDKRLINNNIYNSEPASSILYDNLGLSSYYGSAYSDLLGNASP